MEHGSGNWIIALDGGVWRNPPGGRNSGHITQVAGWSHGDVITDRKPDSGGSRTAGCNESFPLRSDSYGGEGARLSSGAARSHPSWDRGEDNGSLHGRDNDLRGTQLLEDQAKHDDMPVEQLRTFSNGSGPLRSRTTIIQGVHSQVHCGRSDRQESTIVQIAVDNGVMPHESWVGHKR
ncbi:hypothetical protein N7532_007405 [Penicillium argentinense]|uniref:Uncharacterized protein n=1 Tax=Penicillium argentinense TaxID=1131581 RepID=A0A9W9K6P9_9EURO|nr:uncharacterized protein N7532_007405 [Penicillium argentinense]KAJ5095114.1 hypothetical protein N7532_007405 [Penicillium argentinense]